MLAWLAPLLVLGLVVFVHELGHFIAAKSLGVYAPRFSLGWGKALLKWRPKGGETEYVLSALPIGGYVRMASRADETAAVLEGGSETPKDGAELDPRWDPDAMMPHGPKPVPADRWFESKPTWARVIILLAGVTMNALLALVVSTGVFAFRGVADAPTVVDTVIAGRPAERGGLQRGDSVISVNGAFVRTWSDLVAVISKSAGVPLHLDVARGTQRVSLEVTPEAEQGADPFSGKAVTVGRIGAGALSGERLDGRTLRRSLSLGESISAGWITTWRMGGEVLGTLRGLVRGTVSVKQLGGPIAIARASVQSARAGVEVLFGLIAFLSINLAVLNLLPIPILDGGQILMTIAEGVRGKAFGDRTRENVMRVGLAAILALFVLVMFNDIRALVTRFF
ncbi:MAG: RIP metalloprotease RseP [Gemmatimonadales bacterium]